MNVYKYLKDEQHYADRYDLGTIEECLDYYQAIKKGFEEKRGYEEFKKFTNKKFNREVQKVLNLLINTLKGERFRKKAKAIQEWMDKDRKEQEKYDRAIPPTGIVCKECKAPTKVTNKDLLHSYEENSQVLFMFRCIKCNKGQAFYEDGTEWIYDPPKCPKCNAPLKSDHKDVDEVMTTTWSCTKCSYKKEDVYDFKKSRLEREKEEAKQKQLLVTYREVFCLPEKEGQEYIELAEAMEVGHEVYEEELQKYDDSAYVRSSELKKLTIMELEKVLNETLEKEKYVKLSFDKPEMGQQVIVPFTIQDAASRSEHESRGGLKKLLNTVLEGTNWRLMSDGVRYRLGYLYGNLKGYEGEEALLELAGKRKEQKRYQGQKTNEKREKYASNNVVQMAKLTAEIKGRDLIRKRRLEKEPNGFPVGPGESPMCKICLTHLNSSNGWYDKYGFKCLDCQRALNEGVLPPEAFEDDDSWYSEWYVESEFHIPAPTIKKLVRERKLKPRIVTNSSGRDHAHVFMALENNDLLEIYMQKHRIILLTGIPASGKSAFGKYLQDKYGYTYILLEANEWADKELQSLWNNVFKAKREYNSVEKFVCYLHDNYENVALDWRFSVEQMRIAELLKRQWCEVVWLSCSTNFARKRFIKKNKNSATYFDTQIKNIEENKDKILKNLNPKIIDALKDDKTEKSPEEIYSNYLFLTQE
jgi:shikimate kinase